MKWPETLTAVSAMACIVVILYLGIIDGLKTETLVVAIITVAGLGGYSWAKNYLSSRGE